MKVKDVTVPDNARREINIDERIQQQAQIVKQAETQLAFENGKLRMLLELISPDSINHPESETAH